MDTYNPTVTEFVGQVMDDSEQVHDVKITYEWTQAWLSGVSVWGFDYSPEKLPNMNDRDLCHAVKDLIREYTNTSVTFY